MAQAESDDGRCGFKIDKRWPCSEPRGHELGPAGWSRLHVARAGGRKIATAPDGMTFFEAVGRSGGDDRG